MTFAASELSQFEVCPRLPQIMRIYEPPQWPIREAVKQFLERGIRGMFFGNATPEELKREFIDYAANPGFVYPGHAEPFILANDYADWIEGALEIIQEERFDYGLTYLPLYDVGPYQMHVEGWIDRDENIHLFKASSVLGGRQLYWPEIAVLGLTGKEVIMENYRLPSVRDGRLVSPLCMGFKHPSFDINIRIARLYDEPEFNKNWKKTARWEIEPKVEWMEWRRGIEHDQCLDQVRETYRISPILDVTERNKIIYDVEHMCSTMEKPHMWPRFREACQSCVFTKLCHGDEQSRALFRVNEEALKSYQNKIDKPLDIVKAI